MFFFLNSGGKDSIVNNFNLNFNNLFLNFNNNCYNNIEKKYSYFNCKNINNKLLKINLINEYKIIVNKVKNFVNIDYYCNKILKINILNKIYNFFKLISGHYFRNIKNCYFVSIDQKKDQSYFLFFKKYFYSNIGFFEKKKIIFIAKKFKFICYNKKSTTGNCLFYILKKKILYLIYINNMIINIFFLNNVNIGKKIFLYYIFKNINEQFFQFNNFNKKLIFLINYIKNIKYLKIKINSQSIFKNVKIVNFKKKTYVIFYKKQKNINIKQNILLFKNDLIFYNFKIIKHN